METRRRCKSLVFLILAFVYFTGDTCRALSCYNCGWSADICKTKSLMDLAEEPPPYPVADRCIGDENHLPDKDMMERSCLKQQCRVRNPACMKWTFLSGSPENITFMCVGNPGSRTGCYSIEIPHGDKEKKYNTKIQNVEVCLCNHKDYCNSSVHTSSFAILTLAVAISVLISKSTFFSYS